MPLFPFGEERFDPYTAFTIGFLVRFGRRVVFDPIQHLLVDTTAEAAPLFAGGTLRFEWASVAVSGIGTIAQRALGRMPGSQMQLLACGTDIHTTLTVIGELLDTEELASMIHIRNRNIGMNALVFD